MGKEQQERQLSAAQETNTKESARPRPKRALQPESEEPEHKDEAVEALRSGYEKAENVHKVADIIANGQIRGAGFKGLSHALTEDSLELYKGKAGLTSGTLSLSGAALGIAGIADGIIEMVGAHNEKDDGDAAIAYVSGASSIVGGGASLLSLGGAAAPVAPIASSFGTGLKVGKYGNHAVQEYGWFKNDDGQAETASSWAAQTAGKVDDYVADHVGHGKVGAVAGKLAGNTALAGTTLVAAGASLGAATDKAVIKPLIAQGKQDGKNIANDKRAAVYAGTFGGEDMGATDGIGYHNPETGNVEIVHRGSMKALEAGKQMSNYDDEREDAITASHVLHPERWGEAPNAYSMVWQLGEEAKGKHE